MGKAIILDPKHYLRGVVPLFRGDRWALEARLVDRIQGFDSQVDLTDQTITAYFPGTDGDVAVSGEVMGDAQDGRFRVVVPVETSPDVALSEMGTSFYATFDGPSGIETAEILRQDLVIRDRGFQTF